MPRGEPQAPDTSATFVVASLLFVFTFTNRQCRATAFALLALFVSALGLLGVCAVWCGPVHGASSVAVPVTKAPTGAHSCCAAKATLAKGGAKESKKPACCTHEKAFKGAAVPDSPLSELAKLGPPVLQLPPAAFAWLPGRFAGDWAVWQAVRLVPPQHLPPKIPDLRVFLRSLTV